MEHRIEYLLMEYCNNRATTAETEELMEFIRQGEGDDELQSFMERSWSGIPDKYTLDDDQSMRILTSIIQQKGRVVSIHQKKPAIKWAQIAAAAVIFLMLGTGAFLYFSGKQQPADNIVKTNFPNDVEAPKITRATITLADGRTVALESVANGMLAMQGDVRVVKNAEGEISYQGAAISQQPVTYNTLYNPRGSSVVSLTLADGSKVWLNAESSLKYPVVFTGSERRVEITGEAYFEVAKVSPSGERAVGVKFFVDANGVTTEVLGTHFNVNSYNDEEGIKVTLLEGSVRVASLLEGGRREVLKPGQQAQVQGSVFKIEDNVDVEQVMAWKNGVFKFNNTNIRSMMKQVARWYDVEIEYRGSFRDLNFGGSVSRKANVSELLRRVEATGEVTFKIEGRKVVVIR